MNPRSTLTYAALVAVLIGCSPADPNPADNASASDAAQPEQSLADSHAATPPVPLYALVPTDPESARLLWVPWPHAGLTYAVERAPEDSDAKWTPIGATIDVDSAVVTGLHDGDLVRLVAVGADGERLATSVALPFSPVSAPPDTLDGHPIVDGRGQDWAVSDDGVSGLEVVPQLGSILVLPIRSGETDSVIRQVLSTRPDGYGAWSAETQPARLTPAPGTRVGASINVSADGIPVSMLTPMNGDHVGYCSTSGWGCIEIDQQIAAASARLWSTGYSGTLSQTWSTQQEQLGMTIDASAEGGVIVEAAYELAYSWLGIPNGMKMAYLRTRPYAQAQITASIDTAGGSVPQFEQPVFSPISVPIFTATFLTITAEFGVSTVAFLEDQTDSGVSGRWSGQASLSRAYETGYSSRRARAGTSGFYGPQFIDQTFDVSIQPEFGDGSRARAWFGWKATGSVVLNASIVGELARADLSATTGLVFAHASTSGAPCDQPVSIAHADIGLGARLDARLDLVFLDPWDFPIADRVVPILAWGRERTIAVPQTLRHDASAFDFRLLNLGFGGTHDHPWTGEFGFPIDASRDVTPRLGSDGLQTYIDALPLDATAHPLSAQLGKYTQVVPESLSPGPHTFAVWMPDAPPPNPTPATLLRAPGQCVSRELQVQP